MTNIYVQLPGQRPHPPLLAATLPQILCHVSAIRAQEYFSCARAGFFGAARSSLHFVRALFSCRPALAHSAARVCAAEQSADTTAANSTASLTVFPSLPSGDDAASCACLPSSVHSVSASTEHAQIDAAIRAAQTKLHAERFVTQASLLPPPSSEFLSLSLSLFLSLLHLSIVLSVAS